MVNSDPKWLYFQQELQNAVEGEELRDILWFCIKLTRDSHEANMSDKNNYYSEIISWDPNNPLTPLPPPGWHRDINGDWIKGLLEETEGV